MNNDYYENDDINAAVHDVNKEAAVSIRGLYKRYGKKVAVNGLSLDIPYGSFYGLVGPNGAGKTTTLTMATGLLMPDGGRISMLGYDVWKNIAAVKNLIGIMPQPDEIFNRLTGLKLLVYNGMLRSLPRKEALMRAQSLLEAFDMSEAANQMVADYSSGMTKKICLACSMIHSPRLLVLDEPFESVDPVSSANLKDILKEYVKSGGTVIISSHVMPLVERMCTHVGIINKGQVMASGTVDQVANGMDLEERFLQLVGGRHEVEHLAWLETQKESSSAPHALSEDKTSSLHHHMSQDMSQDMSQASDHYSDHVVDKTPEQTLSHDSRQNLQESSRKTPHRDVNDDSTSSHSVQNFESPYREHTPQDSSENTENTDQMTQESDILTSSHSHESHNMHNSESSEDSFSSHPYADSSEQSLD